MIPEAVSGPRVVAIGRGLDPAGTADIAAALITGGVRAFEITMNSDAASSVIASLTGRYSPDELLVGAGTVLTLEEAEAAEAAGARFLVMPHLDVEIVRWAVARAIPAFPGCLTPTEILAAWRAGAAGIKLFPASAGGPTFVRELRGPFRDIPFIPTGGVTLDNAASFIAAGAVAVGMGSWLTGSGDPGLIRDRAAAVTRSLAQGAQ